MKKGELVVCLIWIFIAIGIAFQSFRLKLGDWTNPGSGFLPFCSSAAIGILSILLLLTHLFKRKKNEGIKEKGFHLGEQWKKAAFLILSSFIYIFLMWNNLGYLIGTFIFLFFLLKMVGDQSYVKSFLFSVVTTAVSYLLFQVWLRCMLPEGLLKYLH